LLRRLLRGTLDRPPRPPRHRPRRPHPSASAAPPRRRQPAITSPPAAAACPRFSPTTTLPPRRERRGDARLRLSGATSLLPSPCRPGPTGGRQSRRPMMTASRSCHRTRWPHGRRSFGDAGHRVHAQGPRPPTRAQRRARRTVIAWATTRRPRASRTTRWRC
jgi:hypothetical protein